MGSSLSKPKPYAFPMAMPGYGQQLPPQSFQQMPFNYSNVMQPQWPQQMMSHKPTKRKKTRRRETYAGGYAPDHVQAAGPSVSRHSRRASEPSAPTPADLPRSMSRHDPPAARVPRSQTPFIPRAVLRPQTSLGDPAEPATQPERPPLNRGPDPDINQVLHPSTPANPVVYGPQDGRPPPRLSNPLPTPPRDLYELSPYKAVINLPKSAALLTAAYNGTITNPADPPARSRTGIFGRKKSGSSGGLFRSLSSRRSRDEFRPLFMTTGEPSDLEPAGLAFLLNAPVANQPAAATTAVPAGTATAAPGQAPSSSALGAGVPVAPGVLPPGGTAAAVNATIPAPLFDRSVPPVWFNHQTHSGFMHYSPYRIHYRGKTYPTAFHLHEAMKFLDRSPEVAEMIRQCRELKDIYPLSARNQHLQTSDWSNQFLNKMGEVLFAKFQQHPDLRSLLMATGKAELIYNEPNEPFWGSGGPNQGQNQLGNILMLVRQRLGNEGYT